MKKLPLVSILVFVFMLLISGALSLFIKSEIEKTVDKRLQVEIFNEAQNITHDSRQILREYTSILKTARGLFDASENVTRSEWHDYAKSLGFDPDNPSASAFEFVRKIDADQKENYENLVGKDESLSILGYPDFKIKPKTNNEYMYVTDYIEPTENNKEAFGFDLASDSPRKKALDLARDLNSVVITAPVTLVQEKGQQKSFLMTFPVYEKNKVVDSLDARREFIEGFVLLVIRSEDFFSQVLAPHSLTRIDSIRVNDISGEISSLLPYAGSDGSFSSKGIGDEIVDTTSIMNFGTRSWSYEFYVSKDVKDLLGIEKYVPIAIFILGVIISLLVGLAFFNTSRLRVRAESMARDLTQDLEKFRLAVESVSDQIVITDSDGLVLYGNPATEKITGYPLPEVIGQKAGKLWGDLMSKDYYKKMWKMIKVNKKMFTGEFKNKRKNGEEYTAEVKISPVLDKNNKVIFFVAVERDITKGKRIDDMKTEFVSIASHQLRTPLSAIRWYLEIILSGDTGKLDPEQEKIVQSIYKSNLRMIALVNGLLNVSRIESGKIIVDPKPTDIGVLVKDIVKEFESQIAERKMQVNMSIADDLGTISIDPELIKEVYKNLLTNSLKYSPDGKTISIKITRDNENIISEISDMGFGIPEEDKPRIFEKFYRGTNVINAETDGTGLGLHLAKSIVESSGGKIWFESTENQGTTFWFTLPLKGVEPRPGKSHMGEYDIKDELKRELKHD